MSLEVTDDKSTLVQVMAWCRQATRHYPSQYRCSSMASPGHSELIPSVCNSGRLHHVGRWKRTIWLWCHHYCESGTHETRNWSYDRKYTQVMSLDVNTYMSSCMQYLFTRNLHTEIIVLIHIDTVGLQYCSFSHQNISGHQIAYVESKSPCLPCGSTCDISVLRNDRNCKHILTFPGIYSAQQGLILTYADRKPVLYVSILVALWWDLSGYHQQLFVTSPLWTGTYVTDIQESLDPRTMPMGVWEQKVGTNERVDTPDWG